MNLKRVLRCFQLVPGLKINFQKSNLIGVDVEIGVLEACANKICGRVGIFPSSYFALPLRACQSSVKIWKLALDHVRAKLDGWQEKLLSKGGKVTLLKSVINSYPYFLCGDFKCPWV